jgi:hypothetical protein
MKKDGSGETGRGEDGAVLWVRPTEGPYGSRVSLESGTVCVCVTVDIVNFNRSVCMEESKKKKNKKKKTMRFFKPEGQS